MLAFGVHCMTLIGQIALCIACFAFVDENDLIHSNSKPAVTSTKMIDEAQLMLSKWHGLLQDMGGNLALEKSYW